MYIILFYKCVNLQINISLKEPSHEATIVKDFLYHQGRSKIRDQLEKYIKDLKEGTIIIYLFLCVLYDINFSETNK